jgi:hypothetical protein
VGVVVIGVVGNGVVTGVGTEVVGVVVGVTTGVVVGVGVVGTAVCTGGRCCKAKYVAMDTIATIATIATMAIAETLAREVLLNTTPRYLGSGRLITF